MDRNDLVKIPKAILYVVLLFMLLSLLPVIAYGYLMMLNDPSPVWLRATCGCVSSGLVIADLVIVRWMNRVLKIRRCFGWLGGLLFFSSCAVPLLSGILAIAAFGFLATGAELPSLPKGSGTHSSWDWD
jgi:hypothetical protein